ncbi:MAG: hypothetical protein RL701_1248 [Pseudomonadota bacterium]
MHSPNVLIVGAGPTGLTLANVLARYRIPCTLIERAQRRSEQSKALAINVLSQLSFEMLGLAERLGATAQRIRRLNVSYNGQRLNAVDLRWLNAGTRHVLAQPQSTTEAELEEMFHGQGCRVRRGCELLSLAQDTRGVTVKLRTAQHGESDERYDYIIGCDGKRSRVRDYLGIEMAGHDYEMHLVLGDYELSWSRPSDQGYYLVFDDTFFVIIPITDRLWRVVVKRDGGFDPEGAIDTAELRRFIESRLGQGLLHGEAHWSSRAPLYLQQAASLGKGRVFIAGDSAHLYSPIGGTGMNTGMQDAMNLGWKLAYSIRGFASGARLLESYASERLQVMKDTALATDVSTRLIGRLDTRGSEAMMPSARNRAAVRTMLPFAHSGLAQRYAVSAAVAQGAPGARASESLGRFYARWPELLLRLRQTAQAPALTTHVLVFWAADAGWTKPAALAVLDEELRPYADFLQSWTVTFGTCSRPAGSDAHLDDTLARQCGGRDGLLMLIRPDGVVAVHTSLEQRDPLHDYLRLFSQTAPLTAQPVFA